MGIAIGLGVVAALGFVAVMFVVVPKVALAKVQHRLEGRVADAVPADQIERVDTATVTLGLTSRGAGQARGNGALVLTPTELLWLQLVPERNSVRIPLSSITEVRTARSHLGKSYGRALLYVAFAVDGEPDAMAWYSPDVDGWVDAIGEATSPGEPAAP